MKKPERDPEKPISISIFRDNSCIHTIRGMFNDAQIPPYVKKVAKGKGTVLVTVSAPGYFKQFVVRTERKRMESENE